MKSGVESAFARLLMSRPASYPYAVLWLGILTGWLFAFIGLYLIFIQISPPPGQTPVLLGVMVILLVLVSTLQRLRLGPQLRRMANRAVTPPPEKWSREIADDLRMVLSFPGHFALTGLIHAQVVVVSFLVFSIVMFPELEPGRFPIVIMVGGQIAAAAFVLVGHSIVELALGPLRSRFPPVDEPHLIHRLPRFMGYKARVFLSMMALIGITGALVGSLLYREMRRLFPVEYYVDMPGLLYQLIGIAFVTLAFGTVLALTAAGTVSRLIDNALETLRRLAAGELPARASVTSGGELGVLNASINLMARRMEETIQQLRESKDALAEAERRRAELISNLTHDLRSPISAIMASSQLCEDEVDPQSHPRLARHLRLVMGNAKRVSDLAANLMDLEQLEHKEQGLSLEPVDLREVIEELMEATTPLIGERPIELRADVPDDARQVVTDRDKLYRVLDNLLSNAVRVTKQGEIAVNSKRTSNDEIAVEVSDTGPGIPSYLAQRIFEPRFRVAGIPRGGAGLGLTICKEFSKMLGGRLTVESEEGKGTTFVVELPRNREGARRS